jgi:diguanylate cyclase (GGDEF)-like protein
MRGLYNADRIYQLLILMMLGFAAAAIYIPVQNARVAEAIERALRFELAFLAQEAKFDLETFNEDVARYRLEPTADHAAAVGVDYSILAGRVIDFHHGDFGAFIAEATKPRMEVEDFERAIKLLEPLVGRLDDPTAAAEASDLGEKLLRPAQFLASHARLANSEIAADRQKQLRNQNLATLALTIGLLMTSCGLVAVLRLQNRLVRKTHREQILATKKYEFLADHDVLTGLPNRAQFGRRMAQAFARLNQPAHEIALLSVDLDRFKAINDTLGHGAGDELLMAVARRLAELAAARPGVFVARMGGDEFVVMAEGDGIQKQAVATGEALIEALSEPYTLQGRSLVVRASVGIAIAPLHGAEPGEIIYKSDIALQYAKNAGRAVARLFDEEMSREARERLAIKTDLAQSVERDQFEPHYQPIVDFTTGEIVGVEALARWRHAIWGALLPPAFLPVAEETGLIATLGRRILEIACCDGAAMPVPIQVAVNLSPVQFLRGDIVETVRNALAQSGLQASRLELEIAEGVILADENRTREVMNALRELGVSITLDDFGTGFSSLSHLRRYGFHKLKIDRRLINNIDREQQRFEMVQTIASLGRALGMTIVAEGVETADEARIARLAGCGQGQGYFFAHPMSGGRLKRHCSWDSESPALRSA